MKKLSTALIYLCLILGAIMFCVPGCKKQDIVVKKAPVITWANPADIVEESILSTTQLNAKADIEGKSLYSPAEKTVMKVGNNQVLTVTFTPTDLVNYQSVTQTVKINVVLLAVGNTYQGGKVAYIFVSGDPGYVAGETHGLIAAPSDQNNGIGIQWSNGSGSNTTTRATFKELGTGEMNTNIIVAKQGAGSYAAKLCADLDGYTDWFLPSYDEIQKLYLNRIAIGGFAIYGYWSSTEDESYTPYAYYFDFAGSYSEYEKSWKYNVRAVRYF